MLESKHTTGKWMAHDNGAGIIFIRSIDDNKALATVHSLLDGENNDARRQESIANARLIAAAPDMLELLEDMLEWDGILPHSKRRIEGVIDKAKMGL